MSKTNHYEVMTSAQKSVTRWKNAVLVPCRNEESSIVQVINHLKEADPDSVIVVIDNASTDQTFARALSTGVQVLKCPQPGKARAIQMAINHVRADSYTFIDGDQTYDATQLRKMIELVQGGCSMVIGHRRAHSKSAFPRFHQFGNWMFTKMISILFRTKFSDVLSGLRVLSREFIENTPLTVNGFELEAFYSLQVAAQKRNFTEVEINYYPRKAGSQSKLHSFKDGFLILRFIVAFYLFQKIKRTPAKKAESKNSSRAA